MKKTLSKVIIFVLFLSALTIFIACDTTYGPCNHNFNENVFHVVKITDFDSKSIDTLTIYDLKLNDSLIAPGLLEYFQSENMTTIADNAIFCEVPFSIGYKQGNYSFRTKNSSGTDTTITINSTYSVNTGGCPSYSDNGTKAVLVL